MTHNTTTKTMMLQTSSEQWYISGVISINVPVRFEYNSDETAEAIITLETCPDSYCRPNSVGTDRIMGHIIARPMLYKIEERQVAAENIWATVRIKQTTPAKSCPQLDPLNLVLSAAWIYPKMKRKSDSSPMKIQVKKTAWELVVLIDFTREQLAIQSWMVDSMPMARKTQTHKINPNFLEQGFSRSYRACSYGVFSIFQGDSMQKKKGVMRTHPVATMQNMFIPIDSVTIDPKSVPKPCAPCEKAIHSPISSLVGAFMSELLVETMKKQLKILSTLHTMYWVSLEVIRVMSILEAAMPRLPTTMMQWCSGRSLYMPRAFWAMAPASSARPIMVQMLEYYDWSVLAREAMKGMRASTEPKGIAVKKQLIMQSTRQDLEARILEIQQII